jgi:hypothetical protein
MWADPLTAEYLHYAAGTKIAAGNTVLFVPVLYLFCTYFVPILYLFCIYCVPALYLYFD